MQGHGVVSLERRTVALLTTDRSTISENEKFQLVVYGLASPVFIPWPPPSMQLRPPPPQTAAWPFGCRSKSTSALSQSGKRTVGSLLVVQPGHTGCKSDRLRACSDPAVL